MFAASKFVQNELSGPISNDRLLAAALNLEHVISTEIDERKKTDYLNLSFTEQTTKAYVDEYEIIFIRYNYEHIKEFRKRHLNKSNDLPIFLNKFLKIYQFLKKENFNHLIFKEAVTHAIILMFTQNIQDGFLVMGFINLIPRNSRTFEFLIQKLKPHVWQFLLNSVKSSANPRLYKEMQDLVLLDFCHIGSDFLLIGILIQYGHGFRFLNEDSLWSKVAYEFGHLFSHSFYRIQRNIVEKFSLMRVYLILMLCRALDEEESDLREAMLTVVKQLWRTLPHPFITSQEIENTLGILVPKEKKQKVEICLLKFKQEFGASFSTPRTLRHLCRYAIRNQINEKGKLPEGVEHLPVPPPIKEYLLLER